MARDRNGAALRAETCREIVVRWFGVRCRDARRCDHGRDGDWAAAILVGYRGCPQEMDSRCISRGMKTELAESWAKPTAARAPGKEMMRSRAMWMGGGKTDRRAEARRGACVRACVRAWLRGCGLGREQVFGLGCVAAAPREADVAKWPRQPLDRLELGVRAGMLWSD